jgi:hypothetical protein
MAEKFAVLIKYKYLEYIDSAKLSDADAWTFFKGIIEYDKTGEEPIYSNPVLSGLFAVVKIDLNNNRKSYEDVSQARSEAGKEGAKKRWKKKENDKDSKSHDDMAKIANANDCQKSMAKMHDLDSDSDLDLEFVYENGGGNKQDPLPDKKMNPPPPLILKKIISESRRLGFIIDRKKAVEFYNSRIDFSWYETPYSFLEFVAEKIMTSKYQGKPHDEQQNLFNDAVIAWENLRIEYPSWLEKQKRNDAEKIKDGAQKQIMAEKEARIQRAMDSKPQVCEHCGNPLDEMLICADCEIQYHFDDNSLRYHPDPVGRFIKDHYLSRKNKKETPRLEGDPCP